MDQLERIDQLLPALQHADQVCKATNMHFEIAAGLDREIGEKRKYYSEKISTAEIAAPLLGAAIGGGLGFFTAAFLNAFVVDAYTLVTLLLALGAIIGGVIGLGCTKKQRQKWERERDVCIVSLESQIYQEQELIQRIFGYNQQSMAFLPTEYWYPLATEYMTRAVATGRARSLREAMDLYDLQLHRWKVESANAQMLEMQQTQLQYLASIDITSKVNLAANVASLFF